MAPIFGRADVVPPVASPPRLGLFATFPPDTNTGRGSSDDVGFQFAPENCGEVGVADACVSGEKDIPDAPDTVAADAFVVWAGDRCSAFGRDRNREQRARNQLDAGESFAVARELWRGDIAQSSALTDNKYLADPAADVLTASGGLVQPTSATVALACLEQALGDCLHGARGVIHATRQVVTHWQALNLLRREGNVLLTALDTLVVADAGYDGSGFNNAGEAVDAEDGNVWAYATGPVVVRLGRVVTVPDNVASAFDRSVNTEEWRAERLAAVGWSGCCHLAVSVDVPLCDIGGLGS